jgi:hypothetical protein
MAAIRKFNWLKQPSPWQNAQAWRRQRSTMVKQYLSAGEGVSSALANAQTSQSSGMANLAAQAAIKRLKEQLAASSSQVDLEA